MRKFILPLILASVAASPAMAGPLDDSDRPARVDRAERQQVREERQQAREERQQSRGDRPVMSDRPQIGGEGRPNGFNGGQMQVAGPEHGGMDRGVSPVAGNEHGGNRHQGFNGGDGRNVNVDGTHVRSEGNADAYVAPGPRAVQNPFAGSSDRELRRERREQAIEGGQQDRVRGPRVVTNDTLRRPDRPLPRVLHSRTPPVVSTVPRAGTQPPLRADNHRHSRPDWSTNWRNDHRYDWHNWRNHHHSWFHLGFYYDPFGWGYSPFSIGWRMWPSYYGSRYWINDPYQYRLPYAPPGYRWVRYYDDAVLVDTWSGEVVDVIYDFFW